jgi:hypothetical protein
MDLVKRNRLVARLSAEPEPPMVSIAEFFDGNDDLGSIGCNLIEHPGIATFRDILVGLTERSDVQAVYALISELDPGPDSWPFADLVLVIGSISAPTLADALAPLQPDEIAWARAFNDATKEIAERLPGPMLVAWWD